MKLVLSCEHAGNEVPEEYRYLFNDHQQILASHRGWDPGAWSVAECLAEHLNVAVKGCFVTRLLIEANRSLDNDQLFSVYSRVLPDDEKHKLIERIYRPYRDEVEDAIQNADYFPVVHLSIHTFTPVLDGHVREVDIGLLYDPARTGETNCCQAIRTFLERELNDLEVRDNEPYKGTDDGFTTYLRTKFKDEVYSGIEIEINQKYINTPQWQRIKEALCKAVKAYIASSA